MTPLTRASVGLEPTRSGRCPAHTISRLRLLAPHRASLRLLRSALPPLRPLRSSGSGASPGARATSIAAPAPPHHGGEDETSQVPGRPLCTCPALRPRRTAEPQAHTGPAIWSSVQLTTSTPRLVLSRLYHAACTLSVYASQPGSPPGHATLDSGWWPTFTGQDSHLLGRMEGFRHVYPSTWLPPSPGFAWRNNRTLRNRHASCRHASRLVQSLHILSLYA